MHKTSITSTNTESMKSLEMLCFNDVVIQKRMLEYKIRNWSHKSILFS